MTKTFVFYFYIATAIIAATGVLLCWELIIHQKSGSSDYEESYGGTVSGFFRICVIFLLTGGAFLSGWNLITNAEPDYFSIAFPLVDRQLSNYAYDIEFVKPIRSDLYEVIGYSALEKLFLTITKDTREVHFFPNTDYNWYLNIAMSPDNIDGFIGGWTEGLISPIDQYTPF